VPVEAPTDGTAPDDPEAPAEGIEPEASAPTAEPGSTDVPLPLQPGKIASPR
jgi:hypothetical protein